MGISLETLLKGLPTGPEVPAHLVAALATSSDRVLVVLDDDPTGTQSVADLPVLMNWTPSSLEWALRQGKPAVYVMTNSRSLAPADAAERNRQVARSAFAAAAKVGVDVTFVSRSDSTLRGHFPLETNILAEEILSHTGTEVDGVIIVPAFGDAGRITVGAVHYAGSDADGYTPAGETEFARDATFGYRSSDLRDWVEEKTAGKVLAATVVSIGLATLRTDHQGTVALLRGLSNAQPAVVDIVEENDLRLLALALDEAERAGSRLLYRVGPPFVRALIGQEPHPPLKAEDLSAIRRGGQAETAVGGLIVVGSHVAMTTRQLEALIERSAPLELEIDVAKVLGDKPGAQLAEVAEKAIAALPYGNVVVRTSRALVTGSDAGDSLAVSRQVSSAVVDVVRRILAACPPRFVVAKGGITSSDVASRGLDIERAVVRGPMLPGIVSLWEPMDGPARGIPYIVFAGNVGGPGSLADVVEKLSQADSGPTPAGDRSHPEPITRQPASSGNAETGPVLHKETHMTSTIAVLGLGAMGLPMARHLAQSFTIRSYDLDTARGAAATDFTTACGSAKEAATGADIVLLAVRNRDQLTEVLWGSDGVVPVLEPGSVILLTSTVGIDVVREVADELTKHELLLVDAPVSGGPVRAGCGDLLVTVGADDTAYAKALPVLDAMASTLKRVGPRPGDGQCMKTVNQLLCGVHIAAAAEALALARALGLDPAAALDTLGAGAAESFMLGDRGPRMLQAYDEGGAEVRSRLDIFVKDMGIVTTAARGVGVSTPLAAAAEQIYLMGQAHGMSAQDDSSVITVLAPSISSKA